MSQIKIRLGRRGIAAAVVGMLALVAAVATPQILGMRVASALSALSGADAKWLWVAGIGFAVSVLGAAASWRSGIALCGGHLSIRDACARYGTGSLVNTFIPAHAGDAVRFGLFARALPNEERLWTMGGALAAIGAARACVLAAVVIAGAAAGAVPLWPLLVALGIVAAAAVTALKVRNTDCKRRAAHFLDAFRALGKNPLAGVRITGWIALGTLGRIASATAVGAALGIHHPVTAALVIIPALEVASLIPLTPGNVGITSAAIAVAFQARGVSFNQGLAAGIAFHAVETAVGIMFGLASVLWLGSYPSPAARKVVLLATGASWCLGIAGAFSATVIVPLV